MPSLSPPPAQPAGPNLAHGAWSAARRPLAGPASSPAAAALAAAGAPGTAPAGPRGTAFGRELQAAQQAAEEAPEAQAGADPTDVAACCDGDAASPPAPEATGPGAAPSPAADPSALPAAGSPNAPVAGAGSGPAGRAPGAHASSLELATVARAGAAAGSDPAAAAQPPAGDAALAATRAHEPAGDASGSEQADAKASGSRRSRPAAALLPADGTPQAGGSLTGAAARAAAADSADSASPAEHVGASGAGTGAAAAGASGSAGAPLAPTPPAGNFGAAPALAGLAGPPSPHAAPDTASASSSAPSFALAPQIHSAAFPGALGVQLSLLARNGIEQARMVVNPEQMGPIAVQLALDGTQVRVDFVADNGQTRQLLQDALPGLAGALRDAGFTLAGGGVFQQARDGRQPNEALLRAEGFARRAASGVAQAPAEGDLGLQAARARRVRVNGLVDTFA